MCSHKPSRPAWTCQWCPHPWPCSTAQQQLIAQYTRRDGTVRWRDLSVAMALRFADAANDLRTDTGGLHYRFFGWIRHEQSKRQPPKSAPGRNARSYSGPDGGRQGADHRRFGA